MDLRALAVTLLGLFGSAGCIEAGLVECADGRACPAGLVCDDAHHGCVSPDQLAACEGAADLAPCHTGPIPDGVCFGGICLPAGCGNSEVEPDERCDDGNVVSGDGCSADCRSREVCGDGFADANAGEACDDGDHVGHDGCTSMCETEDAIWRRQYYLAPVARSYGATVDDPFRKVVILFGGQDGTFTDLDDTWEWNGAQWREVTPSVSPPPRYAPSIAYDAKRHRVVMFGGHSAAIGELGDTWEYDGTTWQRLRPVVAPPPHSGSPIAWDPAIGKVVLLDAGMWTWDGVRWIRLETTMPQVTGTRVSMIFDAARDRLMVYGGPGTGSGAGLTDLWEFDGSTWSAVHTSNAPQITEFVTAFVYDPIHRVPIAVTDHYNGGLIVQDTWELSGTSWRLLTGPSCGPCVLLEGTSWTFDVARGGVVEIGGGSFTGVVNQVSQYTYDVDWVVLPIASTPKARSGAALAYDPVRARVVMVGGFTAPDTVEWDGVRWLTPVTGGPANRRHHAMAYDGVSHRVLLFGGDDGGSTLFGDTWSWNGTTWTNLAPVPSPSPRSIPAMAYDSARHRVVMFGGVEAGTVARADTWEWDGTAWHDVTPASSPPGMGSDRFGYIVGTPVMAFDAARARTVLFGGNPVTETWEWDGATWTPRPTANAPEPLEYPAMVYDRAREHVVMFGGNLDTFTQWEWDGTSWTQPTLTSIAPDRLNQIAAAYDEARAEIVKFGGTTIGTIDQVTWLGAYRGPDEEVCGSGVDIDRDGMIGCADPDCAAACEPCGDGTCNGGENDRLCPADCPAAPAICGDAYCAPTETVATCAADCL